MTNSESQRYQYPVCPAKRDHPASLIQIPKFSERPRIVPHEVLHGLYVVARASLVENQNVSIRLYSAFR